MDEIVKSNWYEDDQFANQYTQPFQKEQIEKRWELFASMIQGEAWDKKDLRVLDLGCGDGINILGLKNILSRLGYSHSITAVDFNESRLEKIRMRFPDVRTRRFDLVHDVWDERFDLILFNHVLEHIPEDTTALKNLGALLEKEGMVILGVPNEGCAIAYMRNHLFQRKILKYTDHLHFYTLSTLRPMLETAGWDVLQVEREGFFMPHCRLTDTLKRFRKGREVLGFLGRLFPSQSAGLVLKLIRR